MARIVTSKPKPERENIIQSALDKALGFFTPIVTAVPDKHRVIFEDRLRKSRAGRVSDSPENETAVQQAIQATPTPTPPQIDLGNLELIIKDNFPENEVQNVPRVLSGENKGLDPEAENTNTNGTIDRGIFQINSVHFFSSEFNRRKEKMRRAGIDVSSPQAAWDDMKDPEKNIKMARIIWDEQGWDGWAAAPRDLLSESEIKRREAQGRIIRN